MLRRQPTGSLASGEDMSDNHYDLYKFAKYYDIAFDFRNIAAECDFLEAVVLRHGGTKPYSFLELAAGPARHAREFAKRCVRAAALDISEAMKDYVFSVLSPEEIDLQYICADMIDFRLESTFDLAALLMDSSSYLLDNDAVLHHLDAVADHLTENGLYVIEMAHPRDVFGVGKSATTIWRAQRGDIVVDFEWGKETDVFDPITQVTDVTVTMRYESPEESGIVIDRAAQRCFTANEFRALVTASGRFELVALYGACNITVPFSNDKAAWRMTPVLKKIR